jgi:NADH-quinone oxidoreductase subunit N
MILFFQELIASLPLLITGLTAVLLTISIAWRRNHFFNAMLASVGLKIALVSLLAFIFFSLGKVNIMSLLDIDGYSFIYTFLVLLSALSASFFSYPWLSGHNYNKDEFYLLLLISVMGAIVLISADHMASLFLGIELLSLPLFGLIGYTCKDRTSLEASIKYTILSAISSSFLIFGIALVYAYSGSLSFVTLNNSLAGSTIAVIGLGLILVSISFKLSLFPFHLWTPDVYQGAPEPVLAFLATSGKIAVLGALMNLIMKSNSHPVILNILEILSFCSILFGNMMAIFQNNIKRLLGYSSIAHFGYITISLANLNNMDISLEALGIYPIGYVLSNLGIFGIMSLLSSLYRDQDTSLLQFYRGLFWKHPYLSIMMTIMLLSLAGIPTTLGFLGKFYVIMSSISAQEWWLTGSVIAGSIIALYYYLRIIINLYLDPIHLEAKSARVSISDSSYTLSRAIIILISFIIILFGIYPQPIISIVQFSQL